MKIDELIKCINKTTTTVSAKHSGSEIAFYGPGKHSYAMDYFLNVPVDARVWDTIEFDPDNLDDVIPQDLARTMEVVQRLIDTPVRERSLEKRYRLRWFKDLNGAINCLNYIDGEWTCSDIHYANQYSQRELEKLKKENPRLATAIDAMKEPVEETNEIN